MIEADGITYHPDSLDLLSADHPARRQCERLHPSPGWTPTKPASRPRADDLLPATRRGVRTLADRISTLMERIEADVGELAAAVAEIEARGAGG